ncbi:MAG: PLP-dependent cysteine synthase family protein [Chloroflexi bacterium]|nr:PLP-dependent cysteine synthase family protein [Chloroflexota bacterium]
MDQTETDIDFRRAQELDQTVSSAPGDHLPPIARLIGRTPLLPLMRVTSGLSSGVHIYAKLEGLNPGGSVKDRPALSIVRDALNTGQLTPDRILIDATSGNTGIAYAMLGSAYGFGVTLAMPADSSPERIQILRAYGAELILTDPATRTDGARRLVQEIASREPDRYYHADQYSNPANPLAHYTTTGPEIWQQTAGRITHFVAGMGTSGTMMGVGRYLRERHPAIHLVGVQPDSPDNGIDGLKHLATADRPGIYESGIAEWMIEVGPDDARIMTRELAREEGLFVGISAGAAVMAALKVAREIRHGTIVALMPDGGFKYASAAFWSE